jgi:hypothetical protein
MDAGGVIGKGIGFTEPLHIGGFSILAVTIPAELRNICPVDRGGIIVSGLSGMCPMAIGTIGGIIFLSIICLAMAACKIIIEYLRMAGRTVHRLVGGTGSLQVVGYFSMALGALDILVHRIGQDTVVHIQGDGVAVNDFVNRFILVALHTGLIGNPGLDLGYVNNMRRVTGGAGRYDIRILLPQFPFDDFLVGLFDPRMTLHTGLSNPVRGYR